jgi:hypothetical protein
MQRPTYVYASSTERETVSTATAALQVERSVDRTTQNVGFTGAGRSTPLPLMRSVTPLSRA